MEAILAAIIATAIGGHHLEEKEVRCMADNIYHEARGEDHDGKIIVAHVVMNRVMGTRFGSSPCEVIHQRKQFSWTIDKPTVDIDDPIELEAFVAAATISVEVMTGEHDDMNNGADHYVNPKKLKRVPSWISQYQQVGSWGNHVFYTSKG